MAENSTRNPAQLPLQERAARGLLGAEPELSLSEVLALEHPSAKAARKALGDAIRAAIRFGDLPVRREQHAVQKPRRLAVRFRFHAPPGAAEQQQLETWLVTTEYLDRESYRAWRAQCPAALLSPLSQVFKWLGTTPAAESLPETGALGGAAEKWAALESLLAEIDRRSAETGAGFNRACLPGTKAEFHELLKAYCPAFRYISLASTADYLKKGQCRFQSGVRPERGKGAAIWALFPEYPDLKLG